MSTTTAQRAVSLSGQLTEVRAQLAALAELDLTGLPSSEVMGAVEQVEAVQRQLEALGARVLSAAEADGMWATSGARSFQAWYRNTTGRHRSTAGRQVRQARVLRDRLPGTARALEAGQISADHVAALVRHAVDTPRRREQLRDPELGEDFLVEQATVMDAADFLVLVRRWAIRTDPEAADRAWKEESDRQELTLAETTGGFHAEGWFSHAAGQALLKALDARIGTPAAADTRTTAQRRADALVSLAHLALDGGTLRPGARIRPHLSVHVPFDTLQRLVRAGAAAHPGSRTGQTPGTRPTSPAPNVIGADLDHSILQGTEPATLEGSPIPHRLLARLACQSRLSRVIFGPDSEILDAGREERLFTAAQTRAIIARDGRCQYPGCGAPPGEGEIHHSLWWYEHFGTTSVPLGVLLCWFHHDYVHRRALTIERLDGVWVFRRTDGSVIGAAKTG